MSVAPTCCRIHPPNVCVDNDSFSDRTVITVDSANRPGTLVEASGWLWPSCYTFSCDLRVLAVCMQYHSVMVLVARRSCLLDDCK